MSKNEQIIQIIDSNVNQIEQLINEKIQIWIEYVLFTPLWWLGVALSILPWIFWFKYRKKDSTDRLLYVGLFVMVISLVLDVIGDQFGLWHYRYNVIPVLPTYLPWDLTLMPVAVMTLIQFRPEIHPLIKASFFALTTSYVVEPIITLMKIYQPIQWNYTYSVPIQIVIYLAAHYLSRRTKFSSLE